MFSVQFEDKVNYKSKYRYSISSIRNLSRPSAIRLATVIVLKHQRYLRDDIKSIIREVTEQLKKLTFDFHWKKDEFDEEGGLMYQRSPDVIWLYIKTKNKIYEVNDNLWLARTLWCTSEEEFQAREIVKPKPLGGNDKIDDIEIFWDWGKDAHDNVVAEIISAFKERLQRKSDRK